MTKTGGEKGDATKAPTAKKSHSNTAAAKSRQKQVKIKHHHAKPYRKRHYGSLILLLVATLVLAMLIAQNNSQIKSNTNKARDFITQFFTSQKAKDRAVTSTNGFTVTYDPAKYYASAIDAATGNLYLGEELNTTREYQVVRISSAWTDSKPSNSALTIEYLPGESKAQSPEAVQAVLIAKENKNKNSTLVKLATTDVTIDGQKFLKSDWRRDFKNKAIPAQLSPLLTTYSGIINGAPLTITLTYGSGSDISGYTKIVNDMVFSPKTAALNTVDTSKAAAYSANRTLLDSLLFSKVAQAASESKSPTTEYISSLYGPAVVRVYNVYCQDISIDNKPYLQNDCQGGVGSGFIVSSDGYVATNGHVAGSAAKDAAISDAIDNLIKGDDQWFGFMAQLANLTVADLSGAKSEKEALAIAVNKMYDIPDSRFSTTNAISNLLVTLGEEQPKTDELLKLTSLRKEYTEQNTIKRAKLVALDYRVLDGINGFKASDVALLKIDGNNYPVAKLGSVSDVNQGAALNILGFPAGANDNGLVSDNKSRVTLTSGKVSALKDAQGNGKKLIETDTVIGHGNSGGPALNENGSVVGIATYTLDGSGKGDGVFNYVRDITDLKDLAASKSITFNQKSKTQDEWQKGIDQFYKAHYSKAIKSFEKVKQTYPAHPTAAALIETSNSKIKAGEEVKEFPIIAVLSAFMLLAIIGAGIAAVVIIRHKKKHAIYQQSVSSGAMQPMLPGAPAQYVSVPPQPQPVVYGGAPQQPFAPTQPQQPPVQPIPGQYQPQPTAPAAPQPINPVPPQPQQIQPQPYQQFTNSQTITPSQTPPQGSQQPPQQL